MNPIVSVQNGQDANSGSGQDQVRRLLRHYKIEPEGVNSGASQVMTNCLRIPLILRAILQCFSTTKLIQLSIVNKQWNYEARSLMKKRGNLSASINIDQTCQHLGSFASVLRHMKETSKIVPFSGITISLRWISSERSHWCQQLSDRELETISQELLGGLTWKHLSVRTCLDWEELKHCVAFYLVKKVLVNFPSVLEEFSIDIDSDSAKYLIKQCLGHSSFSRLKTFRLLNELEKVECSDPEFTEFIKTVVSRAPNLQAFHSTGKVDLHGNLLEGSSAVHVAGYPYPVGWIPESLIIANKLKFSEFSLCTFSGLSLERFNNITSKILQSSRTVMSGMGVEAVFLVPLMLYGICLENVRELTMSLDVLNVKQREPDIWKAVKSFDYTRVFPKLDTVFIMCVHHCVKGVPDGFNEMIAQVLALPKTATSDLTANIKHLKLQYFSEGVLRRRSSFRLLAEMFPRIEKLSITGNGFPLAQIEDIWTDLKQVDVILQCHERRRMNLDSALCGIFPEEVAHLVKQDEEYLTRVNIVPVIPSIAYLKELRTLKFTFVKDFDPTCMFSKVSALFVFQRCPHLTVTLIAGDERMEQAMSHLRPYADVVLKANPWI